MDLKFVLILILSLSITNATFVNYEFREHKPLTIAVEQQHQTSLPSTSTNFNDFNPAEVMVDITNDLSYRILYFHSLHNRNNFAFSPTALMSVLVALYEGTASRTSLELRNSAPLPANRDVIRVGYRDIHRRLRTYFFDKENPLFGLSLNRSNVTITKQFADILKFYGFDPSIDMLVSSVTTTTSNPVESTMSSSTSSSIENSNNVNISTISEDINSTTTESVTEEATDSPKEEEESTTPSEEVETIAPNEEVLGRLQQKPKMFMKTAKFMTQPTGMGYYYQSPKPKQTQDQRKKRHLFGGWKGLDASVYFALLDPPEHIHNTVFQPSVTTTAQFHPIPSPIHTEYHFDADQSFITSKANPNGEIIDHVFYLNSHEIIHTMFRVYNSVLYYKYLESMKLSILELELDSIDYNLMILLPDFNTDLSSIISQLRYGPNIRVLRKQLKPRWVQAIIPDFKLNGQIYLTNDLQSVSILNITFSI
ncbi:SRPN19 family protein [Megaselia abdita]